MNLYENCLKLSKVFLKSDTQVSENPEHNVFLQISDKDNSATLPAVLLSSKSDWIRQWDWLSIYYISDIHLVHHVLNSFPNGATNTQVKDYVEKIADDLFVNDFLEDITQNKQPIIFFGGDISSDYKLSSIFYTEFIKQWGNMERQAYDQKQNELFPLLEKLSKLKLEIQELELPVLEWKSHHSWTKRATKPLDEYGKVPIDIKQAIIAARELKLQAREIQKQMPYNDRWREPYKPTFRSIYAILGNHELWDFDTISDCYEAYGNLFNKLDICFLQNDIVLFDKTKFMKLLPKDSSKNSVIIQKIKEAQEIKTKRGVIYPHNVIIVGGTGFAAFNNSFNANAGIYRNTLNRTLELAETTLWMETYKSALELAKKSNAVLIVLTHNPLSDWTTGRQETHGCIYFSGHTHRNFLHHDEERDVHFYADNQVGYKKSKIAFKKTDIYRKTNPFSGYIDGYHEIESSDYLRFYDYMCEQIAGNGIVERQLTKPGTHFYMIKHEGYYGFFLTSDSGTYICAGGRPKKISFSTNISVFNNAFMQMIDIYLNRISPFRKAQESISEGIKQIGGSGKIHGCIIDIDFNNHVMLNPQDGAITYYYSPVFGYIEPYNDLLQLLTNHNPELAKSYKKLTGSSENTLLLQSHVDLKNEIMQIDIKNSVYEISNRLNQLQRLFDKHILRDWNEDLLTTNIKLEGTIE